MHIDAPAPRDVPGYQAARDAGLAPTTTSTPPTLLPGLTAARAFRDMLIVVGVIVALMLLVPLFGSSNGQLSPAAVVVMLTLTGVGWVSFVKMNKRFRARFLAELQAGYTTNPMIQAKFWNRETSERFAAETPIGWNWTGTWVLKPDGTIQTPPTADVDPPGMYPSPNQPDRFELWTGYRWGQLYQQPPE